MANKNFNIGLIFNANTSQAKAQVKDLRTNINNLLNQTSQAMNLSGWNKELDKVRNTVKDLKLNLDLATNVDTGRIDMTKFNANLKRSGLTIKDYRLSLSQLGAEGRQAFSQLTQSVLQAEMPVRKTSGIIDKMWGSLKNVATWQMSSTALNSITQVFSEAFQYVQDLNKGLNDIRIVTGYSADEMERFAVAANNAAKGLSTTTNEYVKASLIYFQQGLNDKEVKERTDATIKLANVTGESAETVSEWMTAIWNNFDDGSKSLEHYADVLTKLGAATASSSDEIAGGLEKFAAIADTVGLSYEYAATALATITAQTRQSEDVVGTGLRTIFSRLQSLSLGEALEDGTDLTKYSQALETVGINIKTASGDLRDMDDILNDLGARWEQLGRAEQNALAQTVGGVRQYTNLIALMDNWDVFKDNLALAENSMGELNKQNEIYAESWEAASNRVKSASEDLYSSLVDDDFFIGLTNGFADVLDKVDDFIEAIGGLRTLIPLIGGLLIKNFGPMAMSSITSFVQGARGLSEKEIDESFSTRRAVIRENSKMWSQTGTTTGDASSNSYVEQEKVLNRVEAINRRLTNQEKDRLQYILRQHDALAQEVRSQAEVVEQAQEEVEAAQKALEIQRKLAENKKEMASGLINSWLGQGTYEALGDTDKAALNTAMTDEAKKIRQAGQAQASLEEIKDMDYETYSIEKTDFVNTIQSIPDAYSDLNMSDDLKNKLSSFDGTKESFIELQQILKDVDLVTDQVEQSTKNLIGTFEQFNGNSEEVESSIKEVTQEFKKEADAIVSVQKKQNAVANGVMVLGKRQTALASNTKKTVDALTTMAKVPLGETIMSCVGSMGMLASSMSMVGSSVNTLIEGFKNGNMTFSTFLSSISTMLIAFPMLIGGLKSLGNAFVQTAVGQNVLNTAITNGNAQRKLAILLNQTEDKEKLKSILTTQLKMTSEEAENAIKEHGTGATWASIIANKAKTLVDGAETTTIWGKVAAKTAELLVTLGLNAATASAIALALVFIATIAIVAVVIAGLVIGIKSLSNAYNQDAIAAEKATKTYEQQVKALSEVKQAYDDLKSSIDKYDETQRKIDTMIEGTNEWRNAVTELNAQVVDLINKYPELASYVDNVNGRLVIREEGTKKLLEEEEKELALSQAMVYSSQVNMNEANMKAQRTQKARDEVGMNMGAGSITGTLLGVGAATAIATAINPLLGAIVGLGTWAAGSIEMAENQKDESDYKKAFDALSSEYAEKGEEMFTEDWDSKINELIGSNKEVAKSLKEDKEAIQESIRQQKALEESNRLLREQIANQVNKNDKRYQDGNFQALYDYVGGQKQADEQTIANKTKEFTDLGAREATEKYLELTYGKDWASKYRVQNWAGKGVTIQVKTEGGGWKNLNDGEKDSWDWKELAKQAASLEVADLTEEDYEAIDKEAGGYAKVLKKYKSDELDETDIQGIASDIYKIQHGENLTIDLTKYFSTSQEVEDFMKSIPQGSNNPVYQALQKAYEGYDEALRNSKLQNSEKFDVSNYNNLKLQETLNSAEIDKEQYETYTKTLEEAYNLTEDFAKVFAETRIETTQGIIDLSEALNDNIGVLTKADKTSLAYAKALNALKASLKTMLDIELDEDVVEELFTEGVLEKALVGDTEAIATIFKRGSEKIISELDNLGGAKDNLSNMSNQVYSSNISDGTALSNIDGLASYSNKIAEDIRNGNLEIEDAVETLNSMGFEIDKDFEAYLTGIKDNESKIKELSWDASAIKFIDRSSNFDLELIEERKKALEEEIDRYWTINQALEKQDELLNQISKVSDRAFGGGKIKALQAYRGELANSNALLSQKLKEIQFWLSHDLQKLEELQIKIGIGIEIDESGMISNYEEVAQYLAKNGQETVLKEFNDLKDKIADSHSEWRSVQSQIIDNNYEIEDTILEEIDVAVNFDVEAAEFALGRIERALDRIEDKAFSAAEAISLMADQMEPNLRKIEAAEKGIEEIFKKNGLDGLSLEELNARLDAGQVSMNEADIEKLKEYYDIIEETRDAIIELHQSMHDKLIVAVDEFSEKIKEQTSLLEHYNSILENHENIIGLIGKANLGISNDLLKQINQKQVEIARTQLDAATQTKNALANDLALAEQTLAQKRAEGADKETIRLWENTVNEIREKANEAESEYFNALNTSLEAAAGAFKSNVEMITEEFSKAVSSIYGTIEKMREAFDRQQKISKKFLQDYEKTYEISKLNRNITNSIDNTKNLKAQQQLAGLAAELNAYSVEGREMSKIDLEYMQKKYDLMVAQIALEEAQNAKNQVRLTRDSSGNWGYVYTANEQATDKAVQSFEDKRYAMEQFMANTEINLTQEMLTLQEEYQTKITELADKYGKDSKEFKTESAKLAQQYTEDLDYIIAQYTNLTDRGAADAREWGLQVAEDFRSTLLGSIYPTYGSFTALQNDTNIAVMKALSDLNEEYDLFSQNQGEAMSAAGLSMDNYAEDVQNAYDTVTDGEQTVKDSIDALVKKHLDEMPKASQAVADWESAWDTHLKEIRDNEYWSQIGSQIELLISKWSSFTSSVSGYKPPKVDPGGEGDDDQPGIYIDEKQDYGRVSVHDKSVNGTKYYAYQKVNDGKLDTASEITYLTEADAKKYANYTEEKHTRDGKGRYRNVQFATGINTYTENELNSLSANTMVSVDHFIAVMDYSEETPTLYYLIPSKNQRVSVEKSQLYGRELCYKPSDAESYNCSNVFWGSVLVAKESATFSDKYGIDITKYGYPETERKGAGTWVSDEKTVRNAEYMVDKVIIGSDGHLYYQLSSRQDGKVKAYGGEWYLASDLDKVFQSKPGSFDTGGYTGDWGSEGKLAVLHQKEIVLNATDTENFLTAIQIVRSLSDKLERNALLANQGLGNIIASSNLSLGGDTLEQHVTITAEFPNVVDHNEIQEAFNTLVNQASQYANR